jgi:hypothetical protein
MTRHAELMHTVDATPLVGGHITLSGPSSGVPLQSLSTPSHASGEPGSGVHDCGTPPRQVCTLVAHGPVPHDVRTAGLSRLLQMPAVVPEHVPVAGDWHGIMHIACGKPFGWPGHASSGEMHARIPSHAACESLTSARRKQMLGVVASKPP